MAHETTAAQAIQFLRKLVDPTLIAERPALIAKLRPSHEDYAAIFVEGAAAQAEHAYQQQLWSTPVIWPIKSEQTEVHIRAAVSSDELLSDEAAAAALPGGYREIASLLQPGIVIIAFEIHAKADSAGLYFDGLVPRGDRFVWCPKPWRVVAAKE